MYHSILAQTFTIYEIYGGKNGNKSGFKRDTYIKVCYFLYYTLLNEVPVNPKIIILRKMVFNLINAASLINIFL